MDAEYVDPAVFGERKEVDSFAAVLSRLSVLFAAKDAVISSLRAEIDSLKAEGERTQMRLVACGVVALSDTFASLESTLAKLAPEYRSASVDDVVRTVRALIDTRAALDVAREEAAVVRAALNDGIGKYNGIDLDCWCAKYDARQASEVHPKVVRIGTT